MIQTLLHWLRPFIAGLALAYLATSFFDVPHPIHFASKDGKVDAGHTTLFEPEKSVVLNKNVLKLGNPVSVGLMPEESVGGGGSWSITGTVAPLDGDQ